MLPPLKNVYKSLFMGYDRILVQHFLKMNKKLALALLASPSIFSSILLSVHTAKAAEMSQPNLSKGAPTVRQVCSGFSCARSDGTGFTKAKKAVLVADAQPTLEFPMTEEESDAAVAVFGCDCPTCVNSLRQLRGQAPYQR